MYHELELKPHAFSDVPLKGFQVQETYSDEWFEMKVDGFRKVGWAFKARHRLICNGMRVVNPISKGLLDECIQWFSDETSLEPPDVAVWDPDGKLPLTTQQYAIAKIDSHLAYAIERDVILSLIAHSLIVGPESRMQALGLARHQRSYFPLSARQRPNGAISNRGRVRGYGRMDGLWVVEKGFVLFDSWLLGLVVEDLCMFCLGKDVDNESALFFDDSYDCLKGIDWPVHEWFHLPKRSDSFDALGDDKESWFAYICDHLFGGRSIKGHAVVLQVAGGTQPFDDPRYGWPLYNTYPFNRCGWSRYGDSFENQINPCALQDDKITKLRDVFQALASCRSVPAFMTLFLFELRDLPKSPTTPLAQIWNEVLGPEIIPFDTAKRQALIEKARQHPEVKRHLEYWERRKRNEERPWFLAAREES